MGKQYYDDDDFDMSDVGSDFDSFDIGAEDMDIFDFDDAVDANLIALDAEIESVLNQLAVALRSGADSDTIDRLNDELEVLELNYNSIEG